jgi:predicted AlkP superfamily pyrophosphatase or phosphodiesterase
MLLPALVVALAGTGGGPLGAPRPRLVVVITVDQLRPDYLDRYRRQLTGGLGRLLRQGAYFANASQDHAVTETAPGHATILSGRWPARTGILSNSPGVNDSSVALLEVPGPGASPARFRGTAFFDWLKAAQPSARALSVSRKDRGAILPVGQAKEQVYWYQFGIFTTSTYYADSLPTWVRAFNARRIPFRAAGRTWSLLLPASAYPEPDSVPYENVGADFIFPHTLPDDSVGAAVAYAGVPSMDSLTLAFALEGVRALGLGPRGGTDLLAVSLSATDAIGHAFGPDSREIHDQVLRLDRYLAWFLEQVFVRYGRGSVLVVLTADHGVTPLPERSSRGVRRDATRVFADTLVRAVNASLDARVGDGDWLVFDSGMLFAPARARLAGLGVDVDSLFADVRARLRALPGVARVDRPSELTGRDAADPVMRRWLHHIPPGAGVELVVTLKPYSVWGYGNLPIAMHGQPTDFDARVPIILWGRGVRRGVYESRVATVDIAPTLARLLEVTPAEPLDGRVLNEALELD